MSLLKLKDEMLVKTAALEIKGSLLTVLVLQVNSTDQDLLSAQLQEKIVKDSPFFANTPIIIDLSAIEETAQRELDLVGLVSALRERGVVPVALRGAADELTPKALETGIGILPSSNLSRKAEQAEEELREQPADKTEQLPPEQHCEKVRTRVISQPIRSGQQIFAQGDLVILSSVNAGAEVLAKGNIHVYGPLRGRALAGVEGDESACIFSLQCNPELIAVAGDYMVNESLDSKIVNQSVMISRNSEGLVFSPLGAGQGKS